MKRKRDYFKNASEGPSWINIMGFFLVLLACLSLVAIIFYLVYPYIGDNDITVLPAATVNAMMISCITLSITLSIAVPWMMSKSQINSVVEQTVQKYYDKDFSQTIQNTHNSLFQAYANDSRMIAYLLCKHNKPLWALGWVCKSSTTYDRVHDNDQHRTYKALAISNVFVLIECILQINNKLSSVQFEKVLNDDNDEKKDQVAIRTTRDLIKFCSTIELRDRDYATVFEDKAGKDIPETLNDSLNAMLACLILYLSNIYKDNLLKQLELESNNDGYASTHAEFYEKVKKECNKKNMDMLIQSFRNSASSLDQMYQKYLTARNN